MAAEQDWSVVVPRHQPLNAIDPSLNRMFVCLNLLVVHSVRHMDLLIDIMPGVSGESEVFVSGLHFVCQFEEVTGAANVSN